MKKYILIGVALLIAALFFLSGVLFPKGSPVSWLAELSRHEVSIVIDPGHGGMDGGAQSRGGVCEKDINLAISLMVKELAEEENWHVIMTRDEDVGLYSEEKGSIRSKKVQDLQKRQEIINDSKADAAVSIHLNSYPSQSVKGVQVFYSKNSEEGKIIAEIIQEKIKEELDPENHRLAMAKDDIAIMKNNSFPLVLVECGFLSNDVEVEKLQNEEYQRKIAECIIKSLKEYFIQTGKIKKADIPKVIS